MTDKIVKVTVRIEGLDALIRKLNSIGPQAYRPAIAEAATHVKGVIATYPPQRTGRRQPFKTAQSRRFFFAALRDGRIEVPYRRGTSPGSEAMGRRWTIQFRNQGKTAIVGNNASYVSLVHGHTEQSRFHKEGGWKTDRQIADQESREVKRIFSRHIARWSNA